MWFFINQMRIWHEKLIPRLCQKHLCACWREGLGAYKIITENKTGYRNHPAVKEFKDAPQELHDRLKQIREEMLKRGYHPKELGLSWFNKGYLDGDGHYQPNQLTPWQTLEEQIKILKTKGCKCDLSNL